MAINFTDSPANGATQVVGGRTYTYNSAKNKWDTTATEVTGPTATVYATVDALPTSGNITGAQAYVSGNNRLYIWNGTGWYNIALINTAPTISGVNAAYELATDGSSTSVVITATDPEGLPLTYSIVSDTSGDIATVTQGVGGNTDIFTITPTTNTANGGTFSLTFRASDGVNIATAVSEFTLVFKVTNSNYTTALITTNGSTGQNTTFTDSSTSSHTLTTYGNVNQSSFSPYRSGGYSAYFDGATGTKITTSSSFDFSGAYTVEYWVNTTDGMSVNTVNNTFGDQLYLQVYVNTSTGTANHRSRTANSVYNTVTGTTDLRDGQWHHIAAVRNSSGIMTLYVDGVSEGTSITDSTNLGTNQQITIGAFDYENTAFDGWRTGYVRDFRVSSNARYSSNFTAPTEPLTADSNTALLTCHLPYFADGSTNNHTITPNGNASTQPFGPYDYKEYAVGNHGGSAYFDSNNSYLTTPDSDDWYMDADFTVEFWFYKENTGTFQFPFSQRDGGSAEFRFVLDWASGDVFSAGTIMIEWHASRVTVSGAHVYNNAWNHIVLQRSGTTVYVYVNGVLRHSGAQPSTLSNYSVPLYIGNYTTNSSYDIKGNLTDFRWVKGTAVYSTTGSVGDKIFTPPTAPLTAITNTKLLLNAQGATVLDKSQTVTNLILSGATASTTQYKYLPSSIYFDGTNDYARADDAIEGITSTTPFTIEAWVYPTQIGVSGNRDYFFGINTLSAGGNILLIGPSNIGVNGSSDDITDLSLNTWSHIAFVYDGNGGWKYYINGTLDYTHSDTITLDGSSFLIGAEADAANAGTLGNYFGGYLSDIRVTKGLQRYTANFTPPSAALDG